MPFCHYLPGREERHRAVLLASACYRCSSGLLDAPDVQTGAAEACLPHVPLGRFAFVFCDDSEHFTLSSTIH